MDFYRNENENKQSVIFTDDQSAAIDDTIKTKGVHSENSLSAAVFGEGTY